MFNIERTILDLKDCNEPQIIEIFGKQVGMDMERIPDKHKEKVEATKEYAFENFKVVSLYQSEPLAHSDGSPEDSDEVMTASGQVFHSRMMFDLLKEAESIVGIATALRGFEEAMSVFDKITDQVYIDGWATAMVTSANLEMRMALKRRIQEGGMFTTASWSPGQHGFHINNQRPFFEIFKPEEIEIYLKDTLMMTPQKSETMLFGICSTEQKDSPSPCAYCSSRATCPNAFGELKYA